MLWNFYHEIKVGDTVIARQGLMKIAAVGTVRRTAYYRPNWSPARESYPDGIQYPNHIDVEWHDSPRDKTFPKPVFQIPTVRGIKEPRFEYLLGSE
jgi:predicted Mrr-cat superfamily restriction endonuclease